MTDRGTADWFDFEADFSDFQCVVGAVVIVALREAHLARLSAEAAETEALLAAKQEGATWELIGQAIGMPRQGA